MKPLRRALLTLVFGALVKIQGEVLEIKNYDCPISGTMGGHLTLQTTQGPVEVHLAPAAFLAEYGISFAKGDRVEILGNKVTFHDQPALLARKVFRAQSEYTLRDAKGNPLWGGRTGHRKGGSR
jgi:hypothetical protein